MMPPKTPQGQPRMVAKVVSWFETFKDTAPAPLSPPDTIRNLERNDRDFCLQNIIHRELENDCDLRLQSSIRRDVEKSIDNAEDVVMEEEHEAPTSESDDDQSLRGGGSSDSESHKRIAEIKERFNKLKKVDYGGLDAPDYDDESTSSDWDHYKTLPLIVGEYEEVAHRLEGYDDWNEDQKKLHKLVYMRGLHPMIPSNWRLCFRTWGINEPHLDDVFTPEGSDKRTVIHHYNGLHAAGKALESLFFLSQYVSDYEEIGLQHKASGLAAKTLRNYIKWTMKDADLDYKINLPTIIVREYRTGVQALDEMDVDSDDDGGSDVKSIAELSDIYGSDEEGSESPDSRRHGRFLRAMSNDLERKLKDLGRNWRILLQKEEAKDQPADRRKKKTYVTTPPTLYAYAIVQHVVIVASYDSRSPKNPIVNLERVALNDRGQWLWNALSLAIAANMARDALYDMRDTGFIVPEQPDSSDPDL